jgi:hypothetical protein
MTWELQTIAGQPVLVAAAEGAPLSHAGDALSEAFSVGAGIVAIPAARLDVEFFRLSSGMAGEMLQRFVNYGIRPVILGDISAQLAASNALRDFVRESNRGASVWFLPDLKALELKLA